MKLFIKALIFFVLFTFLLAGQTPGHAQITIKAQKVEYPLPHPGMLPDSPIYFFKRARDDVLIFFTRDNIKKADVYLLLSDKKIGMTQRLADRRKWRLTVETAEEAEKNAQKALQNVLAAQKQGSKAPAGFVHAFKLSVEKHREILESLLTRVPSGEQKKLEIILKQNKTTASKVSKL